MEYLLKGPALPVEKQIFFWNTKKSNLRHSKAPHKKFQPIRSSRLAGFGDIYTNALFYYIDKDDCLGSSYDVKQLKNKKQGNFALFCLRNK